MPPKNPEALTLAGRGFLFWLAVRRSKPRTMVAPGHLIPPPAARLKMLTADEVAAHVTYDPDTGVISRRGQRAGFVSSRGYVKVKVCGETLYGHRIAWVLTHGTWPQHAIDHIDGDRGNNRISNLRDVPLDWNAQNRRKARGTWKKPSGKYRAAIYKGGVRIELGVFDEESAARRAYLAAKRALHPGCTI